MTVGIPELLLIWGCATGVGTALFWGTLLLGRITSRVERSESRVDDLETPMDRAGEKMSDLADTVQKLWRPN